MKLRRRMKERPPPTLSSSSSSRMKKMIFSSVSLLGLLLTIAIKPCNSFGAPPRPRRQRRIISSQWESVLLLNKRDLFSSKTAPPPSSASRTLSLCLSSSSIDSYRSNSLHCLRNRNYRQCHSIPLLEHLTSNKSSPTSSTKLWSSNNSSSNGGTSVTVVTDQLIQDTSFAIRGTSWFSWWSQVILTVVSSITLIFARSVLNSIEATPRRPVGFFLAGSGIVLSALSIFWTWGAARFARRLLRRETTRIKASNMLRRTIKVGTSLNLLGIFVTLVGAEEIVGTLCAKVLTTQGVSPIAVSAMQAAGATQIVQPLDILIVQANVNILLSHFVSLACTYWLNKWVDKLDPPSIED